MHHTYSRIAGKPTDYKQCAWCFAVNWYENKECHNCPSQQFKRIDGRYIESMQVDDSPDAWNYEYDV